MQNEDKHINATAHKRLNSMDVPEAQEQSKKSQKSLQYKNQSNKRLGSAGRVNMNHVQAKSSAFTGKNSIKSEKKKATQAVKKQKGFTPQDFSHKYEELMSKKQATQ